MRAQVQVKRHDRSPMRISCMQFPGGDGICSGTPFLAVVVHRPTHHHHLRHRATTVATFDYVIRIIRISSISCKKLDLSHSSGLIGCSLKVGR